MITFETYFSDFRAPVEMESYDVIANQPIVIDNGSGMIKAGFAGDQTPKCHFPNYVGRPKHIRVMAGALDGDIFVAYPSPPICMYAYAGRSGVAVKGEDSVP
ncbi:Actin domain containing protein [Trichuris trichiura]|uniref:Actin domain containing protein n=1 Tax=Trichuris trichiura TaxID=36087 RepID=A0A077Z8W4_TRITR|nr:Actin domain containing protein [Trichuris trichiura]